MKVLKKFGFQNRYSAGKSDYLSIIDPKGADHEPFHAENHFGEAVTLDEDAKLEISNYLVSTAADTSPAKLARKIIRCIGSSAPERITDISCIRKEHLKIPLQTVKRPSAGSLSNRVACHRGAAYGVYDDDDVYIPE